MLINRCCCCFSLPIAGYVIAGVGTFFGLISIVNDIVILSTTNDVIGNDLSISVRNKEQAIQFALCAAATRLTTMLIHVLACISMIVGTYKEKHLLLLPWLISVILTVIESMILVVIVGLFLSLKIDSLLIIVGVLLVIALVITYLWLVVRALYRAIRDQKQPAN